MTRSYQLNSPAPTVTSIDYAAELNEQQLAAVTSEAGPALVIAGAGSGKTRTLTYRVSWLLEQGYAAEQILLLTFTNKAAREMLERVNHLLPGRAGDLWGGTFHSIGHRILRRHATLIGFEQTFTIMDRDDQEDLIEAIISQEGHRKADKRFPKASILAEIFGLCCNTGETLHALLLRRYNYFLDLEHLIGKIAIAYEARKKSVNAMDFDDLLTKTHELFLTHPDIAAFYQERFRAVLVDEYQDTNQIQASLIDQLAAKHRHIMVVGDDAQSIYSWRGANLENILKFSERYPNAQQFRIETNYRSVPQVLKLANASILCNPNQFPKELSAVLPSYVTEPAVVPLATNNEQASFIAQRIAELQAEGTPLHEIAVLYRAHYHSMEIQLELTRRSIPFVITSGLRFFEQAHVKDVAAFMKFVVNPRDEVAFKRFIRLLPGIGNKTAESLWNQASIRLSSGRDFLALQNCKLPAKATKTWSQLLIMLQELAPEKNELLLAPSEMIRVILLAFYDDYLQTEFANYDSRREDLSTLANYAQQFADTSEFLAQLTLLGDHENKNDTAQEEKESVCLSSIHQAKGLEWRVVFVTWLTEGMFPSGRSIENKESLEEERRLFYVAVTRCKEELYLTYPQLRLNANYGEAFQRPSRFLLELDTKLYEKWDVSRN